MTPNPTMVDTLKDQAGRIYERWSADSPKCAAAMMSNVPPKRAAYITALLTVLAVRDGRQTEFLHFIEGSLK